MHSAYKSVVVDSLRAIKDHVIVSDMVFSERLTNSGILLINDDKKSSGIRPRWGKVFSVGPEQKTVKVGQWIMVAHGRWSRGVSIETTEGVEHIIRRIDVSGMMFVSDTEPEDDGLSELTN